MWPIQSGFPCWRDVTTSASSPASCPWCGGHELPRSSAAAAAAVAAAAATESSQRMKSGGEGVYLGSDTPGSMGTEGEKQETEEASYRAAKSARVPMGS